MAEGDRDNTNRGALWTAKGFGGKLDIDGHVHYVLMVATNAQNEKAPAYKAIIRGPDDQDCVVPFFRDTKSEKRKAYASFNGYWISVFINEQRGENGPTLRLSAQKKQEPTPAPEPAKTEKADDDLPF